MSEVVKRMRGWSWLAWVIALVPVVVISVFAPQNYVCPPDEQIQQLFASGRFLGSTPGYLMPYSAFPISATFFLLYKIAAGVPWYYLTLLLFTFLPFAISMRVVFKSKMSNTLALVSTIALLAVEVMCTFYLTYTVAAFLGFSAGIMLVLENAAFTKVKSVKPRDVVGLVLAILGYSLRPESGLAALAIWSPFAIFVLVKNRNAASILRGVAVVTCVALSFVSWKVAYAVTPGWEDFNQYITAGQATLDNPKLSAEAWQENQPELSEADIDVMYQWMFYDDDVFPIERFEEMGQFIDRYSMKYLMDTLDDPAIWGNFAIMAALAAFALVLVWDIRGRTSIRALSISPVFMTLLLFLVLCLRARVFVRVTLPMYGVCLLAILFCSAAGDDARFYRYEDAENKCAHSKSESRVLGIAKNLGVKIAAPLLAVVIAAGGAYGFWAENVKSVNVRHTSQVTANIEEYIDAHPDQIIVMIRCATLLYDGQSALELESWDVPENVLGEPIWASHTAAWKEWLSKNNLSQGDTISTLAERDDMVAIASSKNAETFAKYISQHLGRSVTTIKIQDLGPSSLNSAPHGRLLIFLMSEHE